MVWGAQSDVYSGGVYRWGLSGESGAVGYWSGNRRVGGGQDQNRQNDWAAGQQRRRICRAVGGVAIRGQAKSAVAACLLRLGSGGEADDWGLRLPKPASLLAELDLPQVGTLSGVLHLPRSTRR